MISKHTNIIFSYAQDQMGTARTRLNSLFWEYLDDFRLLDGDAYVQGNYSIERNSIRNTIRNAVTRLDDTIEKVYEAPLFLNHLLDFQWLLHCQVNFS